MAGWVRASIPFGSACLCLVAAVVFGARATGATAPPAGPGPSPAAPPPAPRAWLFAAGVSSYEDEHLNNLVAAESDARAIDALFAGMIDAEHRSFLDSAHATRPNVLRELRSLMHRTRSGDAVIVFLSMHAMRGDANRFYVLGHDGFANNVEGTGISSDDLHNELRIVDGQASHIALVLDTCHSGSFVSTDRAVKRGVDASAAGKILVAGRGVGVLSSSGPDEESVEDAAAGHGLFTEFLIRGLKGEADRPPVGNHDGMVTLRELGEFVRDAVKEKSGDKQHPQFSGDDGLWIRVEGASSPAVASVPPNHGEPPVAPGRPATRPEPGVPVEAGCPAGMVREPAGQFVMGAHRPPTSLMCDGVTLESFCIDAFEVTVDEYAQCHECSSANTIAYAVRMPEAAQHAQSALCNANQPAHGSHPINCVDFASASAYCHARGARLPTEEEWEWAARRGASATPFPWGTSPPDEQLCWSGDQRRGGTCAVANTVMGDAPGGVHDLAGNVWEWTLNPYSRGTRVIRGGAWDAVDPRLVSASARVGSPESLRSLRGGFRCAWPMDAAPPRVRSDMCR
jgi:hypothetical protein